MVTLLSLLMLTLFLTPAQEPVTSTNATPLEVLEVEVLAYEFKGRSARGPQVTTPPGPVDARDITGVRGSTANREPPTIEDRSRELRDIGKGSTPQGGPTRATPARYSYVYRAKVKNISPKKIKSILWEYQLLDSSGAAIISQRLFVCAMTVKAGDVKLLAAGGPPPSRVVDISDDKPQKQKVVINRVEYADRTTWTRPGWKPDDLTRPDAGKDLRDGQCTVL